MSRTVPWKVVPIRSWPGQETKKRKASPFRAGWDRPATTWKGELQWGAKSTLDLLDRELKHLGATNVLLQMAVTDEEIRLDGQPRAHARPSHPGVILTFDSKHGPLSYPCDAFTDWQANVHAIALALEALRKVDRYGITKRGEQYTGWKALPPGGQASTTMTAEAAARVIAEAAWGNKDGRDMDNAQNVLHSPDHFRAYYREAAKRTHPDAGGSTREFQLVQEARRVLEAHHGGAR